MTLEKQGWASRILLLVKHAVKYYLVGGSGVLVNLGILFTLTEFAGLWYMLSSVIAVSVAITSNFTLNKIWTFRDSPLTQRTLFMYGKFVGVSLFGMGVYLGGIYVFVEAMSIYYLVAALISIAIAGSINFVINRRWSFGIKL